MTVTSAQKPIGIIGLGLVGGSLARALSARGRDVYAVETDAATRAQALTDKAVARVLDHVGPELSACETLFIAVPFGALESVLRAIDEHVDRAVLISDVIGVKVRVAEAAKAQLPRHRFIGCHPMAGGELGGYANARVDLFVGKTVAVCGEDDTLTALWQSIDAAPVRITAEAHDRAVAATSHVPYLSALALVRLAQSFETDTHIAGKGFFDATRRADFSPEVMASVVAQNPFVPSALRAQAQELVRLAELVENDPRALVDNAREVRALRKK